MIKEEVIKLRTALKGNRNLPLMIHIDSTHTIINESLTTQFTLWDDDNEVLYAFKLVDMQIDTCPSNVGNAISVIVVDYTSIQAIEVPVLPLKYVPDIIEGIKATGRDVSDDMKNLIINTYDKLLNVNRSDLSHEEFNNLLDSKLNSKDDYYNGNFTETSRQK